MNHTSIVAASVHPLPQRKRPIGIQTFAKLREQNGYYVDKTALAMQLIDSGTYYFLSRPRRFGKSLILDTLRKMFEGKQALFKGLAAESRWDWSQNYPVIRISFRSGVLLDSAELNESIHEMLLMFHAGYLAIAEVWQAPEQMELTLQYPNLEVQSALNNSLLQSLTGGSAVLGPHISRPYDLLLAQDFVGLRNLFHAFYASIANDWHRKNEISHFGATTSASFITTLRHWACIPSWKTLPTRAAST